MAVANLPNDLASRVVALETRGGQTAAQLSDAGERVLAKLNEQLAHWFGVDGYRAVIERAISSVREANPALANVYGGRDQPFLGLAESMHSHEAAEVEAALLALVSAIFALLARLIGNDMLGRLAYQIWPDAAHQPARDRDENIPA